MFCVYCVLQSSLIEFPILCLTGSHTITNESTIRLEPKMRNLHGFSVLRFFQEFGKFLEDSKFQRQHPFVHRVHSALDAAGVSVELFQIWQKEIQDSFKQRNFYGMAISAVPEFTVGTKPLLETFSKIQMVTKCLTTQVQSLDKKLDTQDQKLDSLDKKMELIIQLLQNGRSTQEVCPSPHRHPLEQEQVPQQPNNSDSAAINARLPWPDVAMKANCCYHAGFKMKYGGIVKCGIIFKLWFKEQLAVAWYKMSEKYRKTCSNHFSICKTVVHVMIKNLDAYPKQDDDLDALAVLALTRIRATHKLQKEPSKTQLATKINGRRSIFEEFEYATKDFPQGTPETVVEFFQARGNNPSGRKKNTTVQTGKNPSGQKRNSTPQTYTNEGGNTNEGRIDQEVPTKRRKVCPAGLQDEQIGTINASL